jgi:hypothetical protein
LRDDLQRRSRLAPLLVPKPEVGAEIGTVQHFPGGQAT